MESSFSADIALPSEDKDSKDCGSLLTSVVRYASPVGEPSTCRKQLVVWPMPVGRILSPRRELIAVDLPLLVLPKKAT